MTKEELEQELARLKARVNGAGIAMPASLYYMCHIDNAVGIIALGILSLDKLKADYPDKAAGRVDISDHEVNRRRSHKYVPLYWTTHTPMQYVITQKGIIKQHDLVFFVLNAERVLSLDGVMTTDGNLACEDTNMYPGREGLRHVDWGIIRTHQGAWSKEWKRKKQAEVLVPDRVSPELFKEICVYSESARKRLQECLAQPKIPRADVPVLIRHALYYREENKRLVPGQLTGDIARHIRDAHREENKGNGNVIGPEGIRQRDGRHYLIEQLDGKRTGTNEAAQQPHISDSVMQKLREQLPSLEKAVSSMPKGRNADLVREKELLGKAMKAAAEDAAKITEEVVRLALAEESKPAEIQPGKVVWSMKGGITIEGVDRIAFLSEWEVRAAFRTLSRLAEAMGFIPPESFKVRFLTMNEVKALAGPTLSDELEAQGQVPIALYLHGVIRDGFPTGTALLFAQDYPFLTRSLLVQGLVHEYCHMVKALNRDEGYADEDAARMWEEMLTPAVEMAMNEVRKALQAEGFLQDEETEEGNIYGIKEEEITQAYIVRMGGGKMAFNLTARGKDYSFPVPAAILRMAGVEFEE